MFADGDILTPDQLLIQDIARWIGRQRERKITDQEILNALLADLDKPTLPAGHVCAGDKGENRCLHGHIVAAFAQASGKPYHPLPYWTLGVAMFAGLATGLMIGSRTRR